MGSLKINEQIAALRKQKGVTQEQLAAAIGVTNQSVSKWELGQCCPDIQLIPSLADYFHVSIDTLFGYAAPQRAILLEPRDKTIKDIDPLLEQAIEIFKEIGHGSTALLQRRLQIGYGRAKRLIDAMVLLGHITPNRDGKYTYQETPK